MIVNESINRAIDYILMHLNDEITVGEIAEHCNFSKYYFSRLFKSETGESIYEFIKRLKMEQSAFRLKVERDRSITEVGSDYGYSSSNYSSAFRQHHEQSPVEFRRGILKKSLINPIFDGVNVGLESYEEVSKKVSIELFPEYEVIYERYKGNYFDLSEHWCEFMERNKEYMTEQTLFIERTYDDPSITNVTECLYELCMTVPEGYTGKHSYVVQGGKFAVYHFHGAVQDIYNAYQNIFNVWLPKSHCEIDERYGFEIYRKIDCDSMIMQIDLCIPIK